MRLGDDKSVGCRFLRFYCDHLYEKLRADGYSQSTLLQFHKACTREARKDLERDMEPADTGNLITMAAAGGVQ